MALIVKEPEIIKEEELIFYKVGDKIMSCGLDIQSEHLRKNMGVGLKCSTVSDDNEKENIEKLFENLMVPSGLITMKYKSVKSTKSAHKMIDDDKVIDDDLYDKLLDLVNPEHDNDKMSSKEKEKEKELPIVKHHTTKRRGRKKERKTRKHNLKQKK